MRTGRTGFWVGVMVLLLGVIAAGLWWSPQRDSDASHPAGPLADRPVGGPIELPVSTAGGPMSLDDYRGRHLWVYFGYATCPDVCPMALGLLSGALSRLPPSWPGEVGVLFVSVDPERDTADRLRDYVAHFHPDIDAATGPHAQLRDIAERYGVFYQHTEVESALGYVVDHSSATYLLGPDGTLLEVYPHGTTPAQLVEALLRRDGTRPGAAH